jgi:hypothetical protein
MPVARLICSGIVVVPFCVTTVSFVFIPERV